MREKTLRLFIYLLSASMLAALCAACAGQKSAGEATPPPAPETSNEAGTGVGVASPAPSPGVADATSDAGAGVRLFRGQIGDHTIEMRLRRAGESLSGSYLYDGSSQSLTVKGSVDARGKLTLEEFDGERLTGKFTGEWSERDAHAAAASINGTWSPPGAKSETYFNLTEQRVEFTGGLRIVSKVTRERRPKIDVVYPQLAGDERPVLAEFNRRVASLISKAVEEFKKEDPPVDKSDFSSNYDVQLATDDLVSVRLYTSIYSGGMYPYGNEYGVTYDLRAGRELRIEDLFQPQSSYKQAILKYSIADMNRQGKEFEAKEGAATTKADSPLVSADQVEEWESWTLTPEGLVLHYDLPHVIAALGTVFVPYSELKPYLKPDGAAARFANERR